MPCPWKRRSDLDTRPPSVLAVRRATPSARGYDAAWRRVARARREIDHWLCQPCLAEGRLTAANDVDHIVPIHVRPDWRLELYNTQVICRVCHRRKTIDDARRYGSSETRTLTDQQTQARDEVKQLARPPRSTS